MVTTRATKIFNFGLLIVSFGLFSFIFDIDQNEEQAAAQSYQINVTEAQGFDILALDNHQFRVESNVPFQCTDDACRTKEYCPVNTNDRKRVRDLEGPANRDLMVLGIGMSAVGLRQNFQMTHSAMGVINNTTAGVTCGEIEFSVDDTGEWVYTEAGGDTPPFFRQSRGECNRALGWTGVNLNNALPYLTPSYLVDYCSDDLYSQVVSMGLGCFENDSQLAVQSLTNGLTCQPVNNNPQRIRCSVNPNITSPTIRIAYEVSPINYWMKGITTYAADFFSGGHARTYPGYTQYVPNILYQSSFGGIARHELEFQNLCGQHNPEINITKVANGDVFEPAQNVTYTIHYENVGSGVAQNVIIRDLFQGSNGQYLQYVSSNPVPSVISDGVYFWNIGELNPGAQGNITIVFRVRDDTPAGTRIQNSAVICMNGHCQTAMDQTQCTQNGGAYVQCPMPPCPYGTNCPQVCGSPLCDCSSMNDDTCESDDEEIEIVRPTLTIQKLVNNQETINVTRGQQITYTLRARNTSSNAVAHDVTMEDVFPNNFDHLTLVSINPQPSSAQPSGTESVTYRWNLGDLNPNEERIITLVYSVSGDVPCDTVITNNTRIWGSGITEPYPTDTSTVTVQCVGPRLRIDKQVNNQNSASVRRGDTVEYIINYENNGDESILNVIIRDEIDTADRNYLQYIREDSGGNTPPVVYDGLLPFDAPSYNQWHVNGPLEPGQTGHIHIFYTVRQDVPCDTVINNNATIRGNGITPNPDDNVEVTIVCEPLCGDGNTDPGEDFDDGGNGRLRFNLTNACGRRNGYVRLEGNGHIYYVDFYGNQVDPAGLARIINPTKEKAETTEQPKEDEVKCAKEGESFSTVYKDKYPEKCCDGLTAWESGMDTRQVKEGKCVETDLVKGNPVGTCINCGNGVCESIENICNCSKDCDKADESIISCSKEAEACGGEGKKECCDGLTCDLGDKAGEENAEGKCIKKTTYRQLFLNKFLGIRTTYAQTNQHLSLPPGTYNYTITPENGCGEVVTGSITVTGCHYADLNLTYGNPNLEKYVNGRERITLRAGNRATYRLAYSNPTGQTLNNVTITDPFDNQNQRYIRFVSQTSSPSLLFNQGSMTWTVGTLAPGASGTIDITIEILSDTELPDRSISIVNNAVMAWTVNGQNRSDETRNVTITVPYASQTGAGTIVIILSLGIGAGFAVLYMLGQKGLVKIPFMH